MNSKVACVASGTSALHLALILADVKSGDEVICQSMTFLHLQIQLCIKVTPIFVDSESETWNLCPTCLEESIKERILKGKTKSYYCSAFVWNASKNG